MKTSVCLALAALLLGACGPTVQSPPADRYDTSKMDLKPVPAKLTSERHTGPFASGASLSTTAVLKPLDPSRPVDTRVLLVKVELTEPVPLKLGQRVEVEVAK